jgi:hypothetical protein
VTAEDRKIAEAAVHVGVALSELQLALFNLEKALGLDVEPETLDIAFAETARLAGSVVQSVRAALEEFPEALEVSKIPEAPKNVETHEKRCPDCGEAGETRGHMTCQYPSDTRGEG